MTQEPVLDPTSIAALRSVSPDDDGFLRELVEIFLADTPTRLADLSAAVVRGDATAASRAAHSIKGAAGNFGARHFASLAQQIEHLGKAGDVAGMKPLVAEITADYERVKAAMEALIRA